jgi:hypothetical protein
MAANDKPPVRKQFALLESTNMYRVYVSPGLAAKGLNGDPLSMSTPASGEQGAQQAEIVAAGTDLITAVVGLDPEGNKAIFLVRVPADCQIFKPGTPGTMPAVGQPKKTP